MFPILGTIHLPWFGAFTFYPFFTAIFFGALLSVFAMARFARNAGLSEVAAFDLGLIALVACFLGSRIFHVLFEYPAYYWADPWRILDIGRGGFVSLGAFLGTFAAWTVYFRRKKIAPLPYIDQAARAVPIADFFTRTGCLLEGCCYGRPTTSWFHLEFAPGSTAYHFYKDTWLIPTQPLFMANAVFLLFFMSWFYRRQTIPGRTSALYLILYGSVRFLLEFFRADADRGVYFLALLPTGLSTGQLVMLGFILTGALGWYVTGRNQKTA